MFVTVSDKDKEFHPNHYHHLSIKRPDSERPCRKHRQGAKYIVIYILQVQIYINPVHLCIKSMGSYILTEF